GPRRKRSFPTSRWSSRCAIRCATASSSRSRRASCQPCFPSWRTATAVRRAPQTLAPGARLRLFEAVSALLDAIAAGRPLLLVLDDLHWAERPTIRLLHHLAARPYGAPRMIVAAYRDT